MKLKPQVLVGWILSGLLASFLIAISARGKFIDFEGKEEMFATFGWTIETMKTVGILEVVFSLIFLLPRVSFYGAILLTAYLGGAVATHMRIGEPVVMPILIGALVWVSVALREPSVFSAALLGKSR